MRRTSSPSCSRAARRRLPDESERLHAAASDDFRRLKDLAVRQPVGARAGKPGCDPPYRRGSLFGHLRRPPRHSRTSGNTRPAPAPPSFPRKRESRTRRTLSSFPHKRQHATRPRTPRHSRASGNPGRRPPAGGGGRDRQVPVASVWTPAFAGVTIRRMMGRQGRQRGPSSFPRKRESTTRRTLPVTPARGKAQRGRPRAGGGATGRCPWRPSGPPLSRG